MMIMMIIVLLVRVALLLLLRHLSKSAPACFLGGLKNKDLPLFVPMHFLRMGVREFAHRRRRRRRQKFGIFELNYDCATFLPPPPSL